MIRCALYIRVSTEEQALHGLSLEAQKADLTKYAKEHNYEIVDYYIDEGKTARKNIKNRLAMQRLLDDVRSNKIDLIIFTKIDRWCRNIRDYYKIQETLEAHNVNWKTIRENYDTTTANGRLHINIMLSVAQDEADRTSERIKAVFQNQLRNGEHPTSSLPLGYKLENKKIVIVPEDAEIARDVFKTYLKYQSQYQTFLYCFEKYNISICEKTISRMLKNRLYIGEYRGYTDHCEPIIDKALFDEVQELLKRRSIPRIDAGYNFIFTGIIECAECHHKMVGNAQKRNYGRGIYVPYKCNMFYKRKLCSHNKVIYEHKIEEYLLDHIEEEIDKYIIDYNFKHRPKKKKSKVNKTDIKKKMDKLKTLYINDLITLDEYKKDYEAYKTALNEVDELEEKPKDLSYLKDFLKSDYRTIYHSLDNAKKRLLWRSIIDTLYVDVDNTISIIFK